MKNRSTGRLGRLFNAVIPGVVVRKLPGAVVPSHAVTLEGCCPGSVVYQVRKTTDAGLKPSSMTLCKERRGGFTLIELLVVVLIIGILAAIALPQYQVAVLKSRYVQLQILANSFFDAEELYSLANGTYTLDFTELGIDIPAGWTLSENKKGIYDGKGTQCTLNDGTGNGKTLTVYCSYSGLMYYRPSKYVRLCGAMSATAQKVCKSLGGVHFRTIPRSYTYYTLP